MRSNYKPEIDGLRALAIVSVVIYHAEITLYDFTLLQGGYLGVDIFFVISGFIISTLLLREFKLQNKISIIFFYERRLRRIFPALVFTLILGSILGWFFLLPSEFVFFAKSVISSIIFNANHFFYINEVSYISEEAKSLPLLHLWTLSVEEQFYIFFPIFLLLAFKFLKNQKNILIILIIFFFISLFLTHIGSNNFEEAAFYLLPSRGWEITAGIILSFYINLSHNNIFKNYSNSISFVSFIGLILCLFIFSDNTKHPSLITFIPILLTCLIIISIKKNNIVFSILTNKISIFIGLISFSLYLIHHVIFVFGFYLFDEPNLFFKIILIILSLFIAIISYNFIEQPFRNFNIIKTRFFFILLFFFVTIIFAFSLSILQQNGYKTRFNDLINAIDDSKKRSYRCEEIECENIAKNNTEKIFLLGDSTMFNLEKLFLNYANSKNLNFKSLNSPGCPYIKNYSRLKIKNKELILGCNTNKQNERFEIIQKTKNSDIILAGRYTLFLNNKGFNNNKGGSEKNIKSYLGYKKDNKYINDKELLKKNIKKNIIELLQNNRVIIVYPTPEPGWHVPDELMKFLRKQINFKTDKKEIKKLFNENKLHYPIDLYFNRNKEIFDIYDSIDNPNLIRYYPHKLICDSKYCYMHDLSNIYYSDDYHFSDYMSVQMFDEIIEVLEQLD